MEWNRNALSHLEAILFRIHDSLGGKSQGERVLRKEPHSVANGDDDRVLEILERDSQLLKAHHFFHQVDQFIDSAAQGLVEQEELPDYEAFDLSRVIRSQVAQLAKQHFGFERPMVH